MTPDGAAVGKAMQQNHGGRTYIAAVANKMVQPVSGNCMCYNTQGALNALAPREKGKSLKQMHVLLIFQQGAM